MNRRSLIVVVSLLALVAVGCRPKSAPPKPEPMPQSADLSDPKVRMSELQRYSVELTALARNLPGRSKDEDKELLGDAFDRAGSALTLLIGPEPHGAFRQQLRIIDNVRQQIRSGDMADATVDTGMRSIYNALVGIRERLFGTDDAVRAEIDALRGRIDALDAVRGPLHAVAVGGAFQSASKVIETMQAKLEGRFGASASNGTVTGVGPGAPASAAAPQPASDAAPVVAPSIPPAPAPQ